MATEKVIVQVEVDSDQAGVNQVQNNFDNVAHSADNASESTKGLTRSVTENGGAMGILNMLTGGYAQIVKDSLEATDLFSGGLKAATIQSKLFGTALRTAVTATGIGALVVAVGLLVAYWDDILQFVTGVNKELEEQVKTATRLADEAQREFDLITKTENIRKLQGQTERQILVDKIQALKVVIRTREDEAKLAKQRRGELQEDVAETTGVVSRLTALGLGGAGAIYQALFGTSEERVKEVSDSVKETEDALIEVEDLYAQFIINLNEIDEEAEREGLLPGIELATKKLEEETEKQIKIIAKRGKTEQQIEEENERARNKRRNDRIQAELDSAEFTLGLASDVFSGLEGLAGENEKAQRGFAIAQVITDAAVAAIGIWRGYAGFGPAGIAGAAAQTLALAGATATAINNIKNSGQQGQVQLATPTLENPTGVEGVIGDTTPQFNINNSNQLGDTITNALSNGAFKTYVVSSDVTNQQELDRANLNNATL